MVVSLGTYHLHGVQESVKEPLRINRPRVSFGVPLHAPYRSARVGYALDAAVIEVGVGDHITARHALRVDHIAVVLGGYSHTTGRQLKHRLVYTTMAERHLVGATSRRQR